MTTVPFDLPLRPAEAGTLAELIFEHAEGRPLTDDIRTRLAGRAATIGFESLQPYIGSLERDPVHPSSYYVAVDSAAPLLLHIAAASAPTGSIYAQALLIGRMRSARGPEMVINAIPFAPTDHENIRKYTEHAGRAFLPRPQGPRSAIATGEPAFDAFRSILKTHGVNLASVSGEYYSTVWAAIRAGWREGYTISPGLLLPQSAKEIIRHAAGCTRFVAPASNLQLMQELFDFIRQIKSRSSVRAFDFEPALYGAGTPTTPADLFFYLDALKKSGHAPQLIAPELGFKQGQPYDGSLDELAGRVQALAGIARQFQCTLSIHAGSGKQPDVQELIGKATLGRFNYEVRTGSDVAAAADNLLA